MWPLYNSRGGAQCSNIAGEGGDLDVQEVLKHAGGADGSGRQRAGLGDLM